MVPIVGWLGLKNVKEPASILPSGTIRYSPSTDKRTRNPGYISIESVHFGGNIEDMLPYMEDLLTLTAIHTSDVCINHHAL